MGILFEKAPEIMYENYMRKILNDGKPKSGYENSTPYSVKNASEAVSDMPHRFHAFP